MTQRTRSTCGTPLVALSLFAFFFTAHLKVKGDGSGELVLVYPASRATSIAIEGSRYVSDTTRPLTVRIEDGLAKVRVAFQDVNRLSEAPELRNSRVEFHSAAAGAGAFRAQLRAAVIGSVDSNRDAVVRVTLPGRVVDANAQDRAGNTATWSVPIPVYFSPDGMDVQATFGPRGGREGI